MELIVYWLIEASLSKYRLLKNYTFIAGSIIGCVAENI